MAKYLHPQLWLTSLEKLPHVFSHDYAFFTRYSISDLELSSLQTIDWVPCRRKLLFHSCYQQLQVDIFRSSKNWYRSRKNQTVSFVTFQEAFGCLSCVVVVRVRDVD